MFTRLTFFLLFLVLPSAAKATDITIQSATIQVNPVGSDTDHEWLSILWSQPIVDFNATAWRITLNGKAQKLFTDERWSAACSGGQARRWLIVDNFDLVGTSAESDLPNEGLCWLRTSLTLSNQLDSQNRLELSQLVPVRHDWSLEWQNADWSEQGYPLLWTPESWRYLPFLNRIDWGQSFDQTVQIELTELLIDPPGADAEQERIKIVSASQESVQLADYYLRIEDKLERLPPQSIEPGQTIELQLQRLTLPNRSFELALFRPTIQDKQTLADLWIEQKRLVDFTPKYSGWYQLSGDSYRAIPEPPADTVITQSIQPIVSPVVSLSPGLKPSSSKSPVPSVNESISPKVTATKTPDQSSQSEIKLAAPQSSPRISHSSSPRAKAKTKPKAAVSTSVRPSPTVLIKSSRQSLPDNKREQQVKLLFLAIILIYLGGMAIFRIWQRYQNQPKN